MKHHSYRNSVFKLMSMMMICWKENREPGLGQAIARLYTFLKSSHKSTPYLKEYRKNISIKDLRENVIFFHMNENSSRHKLAYSFISEQLPIIKNIIKLIIDSPSELPPNILTPIQAVILWHCLEVQSRGLYAEIPILKLTCYRKK